jgi:hypothetical protein
MEIAMSTGVGGSESEVHKSFDVEDVPAARDRLAELAGQVQGAYEKVLQLEEAVDSVDEAITSERVRPRLPRRLKGHDVVVLPPGDSDTTDPWTVPDGTADWDVNDPVH